jgi:hypothetical protein
MRAVDQWSAIADELGEGWDEARLSFLAEDPGAVGASAAVLAPLGPGRIGSELRLHVLRRGGGPERLRNLLGRLDDKRLWGTLRLVDSERAPAADRLQPTFAGRALATSWDDEVSKLPHGWRDLLCELELGSSDFVPRAALLGAPLNPTRSRDTIGLRFRVSRDGGYGASPGMAHRCLERMDDEGISGRVTVLHGLSDTDNVGTQGPVWRIGGKSV